MERTPRSGEFYRDYNDRLYQIITAAKHAETEETLVVYQALYGDYGIYALPLENFVKEADAAGDPGAAQKYRFAKVEILSKAAENAAHSLQHSQHGGEKAYGQESAWSTPQSERNQEAADAIDPKLMAFLDTDDLEEKYNILLSMRNCVDDRMINNMAVVLDVVIPEGDVSDRYEALKNCIRTRQRYESDRLRY